MDVRSAYDVYVRAGVRVRLPEWRVCAEARPGRLVQHGRARHHADAVRAHPSRPHALS